MVALSCLQSTRALVLAALVVGFVSVPSFAGTPIFCQRHEQECFYNCHIHLSPPPLASPCLSRCRLLHQICLNAPPTTGINSGTSKALPDAK
jgi:hypothetical protein